MNITLSLSAGSGELCAPLLLAQLLVPLRACGCERALYSAFVLGPNSEHLARDRVLNKSLNLENPVFHVSSQHDESGLFNRLFPLDYDLKVALLDKCCWLLPPDPLDVVDLVAFVAVQEGCEKLINLPSFNTSEVFMAVS